MKKVVKVSIGSIAFTLEEGAHSELDIYLKSLETYYSQKEGGDEIVESIEERLAELLLERGYGDKVVTVDAVKEVMSILGRPEEIESESDSETPREKPKKRLFRNLQNKFLGGVCAGIASYFAVDPTVVRILTVVFGIVAAIGSDGSGLGLMVLLYFALWVIIPGAKTVEQRCQMQGERSSVDSIERKVTDGVNEIVSSDFGKTFVKVITLVAGVFLLLIGLGGLAMNAVLAISFSVVDVLMLDYLSIFSGISTTFSIVTNILFILVILLPFVGMLYAGIVMTFNLKAPRWRPGLINFIIWLLACVGLCVSLVMGSSDYWNMDSKRDVEQIELVSDTLRIEYYGVDEYKDMHVFLDADRNSYILGYVDEKDGVSRIVTYPELTIRSVSDGDHKIKSECVFFPETFDFEQWKGFGETRMYDFDGTTLTLYPNICDKDHKLKVMEREVTIYIPEGTEKVVNSPVFHDFSTDVRYSDINIVRKCFSN
jgi:phage shock protein PspC (stress-responsive transcriptional regulator)